MYLESLRLHNFRCFEYLDIEFDKNLTVIVGSNGSGKTSILEAACIAASSLFVKIDGLVAQSITREHSHLKSYEIGNSFDVQEQYPVDIVASAQTYNNVMNWKRSLNRSGGKTTITDAKDIIELGIKLQNDLRAGKSNLVLPIIAYYSTGRLWDYHREKQYDVFKKNNRMNGYIDCVDGTANIKLMMNWFLKMTVQKYQNQETGLGEVSELQAVYSAMEECYRRITGYDDIKIYYSMSSHELMVSYREQDGSMMQKSFNQLSDGYKGTISLVADIAYRMAVLNPQLLANVRKETDGIVLIDEVDLHLHPSWQQRILGDLQEIFPKVQFIVTTHAPAVINTVNQTNIRILNHIGVLMSPIETYGKDSNSVLMAVMGADERPTIIKNKFREFYDYLESQNYDRAKEIFESLKNEIGGNDPELVACEIKLELSLI